MNPEPKLQLIADQISKGLVPAQESVRSFLFWFNAKRRAPKIIETIRETLGRFNLRTSPDFEFAYIDSLISFEKLSDASSSEASGIATADPTNRIGRLEAANRAPISVKPDSTLQQAVTIMLTNDFSQLPVMISDRDLKGIISWKTIGIRLALNQKSQFVRDYMEQAHVIRIDDSLIDAIKRIVESDCILVKGIDRKICGIITASDFTEQFGLLAEPFLLVGEIENGIRQMLHGKFTAMELQAAKAPGDDNRKITSVNDLTFGEYQRLFETQDRWAKISVDIDRVEFVARFNRIREIRNDIMHFNPEGLEELDLLTLREFAQFLKRLRDVGAV